MASSLFYGLLLISVITAFVSAQADTGVDAQGDEVSSGVSGSSGASSGGILSYLSAPFTKLWALLTPLFAPINVVFRRLGSASAAAGN